MLFKFFEKSVPCYPSNEPALPPRGFLAFVWACARGVRGYVVAMAGLSALIAVYEALLFAVLGRVVDWIAAATPSTLWAQRGNTLTWVAAVMVASIALVALRTSVKHQALAINLPLRLRWNFHRLMLGQSMAFYADEFAGRITTKIMQTALAVRDMIFTTTDLLLSQHWTVQGGGGYYLFSASLYPFYLRCCRYRGDCQKPCQYFSALVLHKCGDRAGVPRTVPAKKSSTIDSQAFRQGNRGTCRPQDHRVFGWLAQWPCGGLSGHLTGDRPPGICLWRA